MSQTRSPAPDQAQSLGRLVDEVEALGRRGFSPVVVFDLDDTLFSTAARHIKILREYAAQPDVRKRWLEEAWALVRIEPAQLKYSILDTAAAAGVSRPELLQDLKSFWARRFFTNDYLLADEPLAGAPEYCEELRRRGARLVYMTGRDETMRQGTERALASRGFPAPGGQGASLILKPRFDAPDLAFKMEAISRLGEWGVVTGAFENEPAHINLFSDAFPEALMYFVDTKHSGKPIEPHPEVQWIKDFRR